MTEQIEIKRLTDERNRCRDALQNLLEKEWQVSPIWTAQKDRDKAINAARAAVAAIKD